MAMSISEWTRGPAIGRGSSATVSLAVDRGTGAVFAVKSVDAVRVDELRRERSILQGLTSPHVVRCLGASGCDMFLEYAPGGSLADEIKRRGGACDERVIRSLARDVLRGLAHVHAAGVAHCDVKARNVLIGADGRAMIADFGCARRVHGIGGNRLSGGTPMFMAPEAARGEEHGTAADIWALGCTVIEMASGGAPWPRFADPMAALRHVALSGEAPECPPWLSEDARDFLARCFLRDAGERWTAEQLLQHRFVADSSDSLPTVAGTEPFVSPKSVLDQSLWGDDSTARFSAGPTTTTAPTDRVRELASSGHSPPEWTWDANWITVHSDRDAARSPSLEREVDTGTSAASGHPAAAAAAEEAAAISAARASHGRGGDSYGDDAVTSCSSGKSTDDRFRGTDCNGLAVTSDDSFIGDVLLLLLLVRLCPSWSSLRSACSHPHTASFSSHFIGVVFVFR